MNASGLRKRTMLMVAGLGGFIACNTVAEKEVKITIRDLKVEDTVYTPYYDIQTEQNHEQGAAQKWIRLGVYFTTEGGWIDEIDVTQMAAINREGGDPLLLSESVHYINIEPGDHYVYVYLHPSYVKRYEIDAFDVDSAAKIVMNGKVVASREISKRMEKNWSSDTDKPFKRFLLNHAETPFWFVNYDFKEIIKRKNVPVE